MKKKFPLAFCSRSFRLSSLLIRGLKLVGSLRNVIRRRSRKLFIPDNRLWGECAVVCVEFSEPAGLGKSANRNMRGAVIAGKGKQGGGGETQTLHTLEGFCRVDGCRFPKNENKYSSAKLLSMTGPRANSCVQTAGILEYGFVSFSSKSMDSVSSSP